MPSITNLDDIEHLRQNWENLNQCADQPSQLLHWILSCLHSQFKNTPFKIIYGENAGKVNAIAACYLKQSGWLEHLHILGDEWLGEPVDLIYASSAEKLSSLCKEVKNENRPLCIKRVNQTSPSIKYLRVFKENGFIVIKRLNHPTPFISINENWENNHNPFTKRQNSDLRRARRKAEKQGIIKFESPEITEENFHQWLNLAFSIEDKSWKGHNHTSLAKDKMRAKFFSEFCYAAYKAKQLHLCFLRIGEDYVAMQIAVVISGKFCLLKIGYDENFKTCSPGQLLIQESIQYAAELGCNSYEFLGHVAKWTKAWTKTEHQYYQLNLYPKTIYGISALGSDIAKALYQKIKTILFKSP